MASTNKVEQDPEVKQMPRQIFLHIETTGLDIRDGNRIIEIGCVEMINRTLTNSNYHQYIQPDRESEREEDTLEVHGITTEFLADKPRFEDIAEDFLNYIRGAELIIHNAAYDIGYLDHELTMANASVKNATSLAEVSDSLMLARQMHPGQRNTLYALCKRYDINNLHRESHGALLDSEILADIYLAMTSDQKTLLFGDETSEESEENTPVAPWKSWDRWATHGDLLNHIFSTTTVPLTFISAPSG